MKHKNKILPFLFILVFTLSLTAIIGCPPICQTDGDCPAGSYCADNSFCQSDCSESLDCPAGEICDLDFGRCEEDGPDNLYEAEDYTAAEGCVVATNQAGYSGSGFMDYGGRGTWMEWNDVEASTAGNYKLTFRYANGRTADRRCAVIVNDANQGRVVFAATGTWTDWRTDDITVPLEIGDNTIRIMADTSSGGPNLDNMELLYVGGSSNHPGWARVPEIIARIVPPDFPARDFNITNYGAAGNGTTDCTGAFKDAISACNAAGGGRVIVPSGTFKTGAIHLKSNVNLHLKSGATIRFSRNPNHYLPVVHTRWEGVECMNYSPLIYAYEKTNIAVTGSGTLDGRANDNNWWPWKQNQIGRNDLFQMGQDGVPVSQRIMGDGKNLRPSFVETYKCQNVLIQGITVINAPMWVLHPVLSTNVTIDGVTIDSHGPNNDGCDPDSSTDVLIKNSRFDTGDDCIALKSGRNNDGRRVGVPVSNVIIQNCTMIDGHGGVVIGSEISGSANNIYTENCTFNSSNLDRVLRIKTNSMRGGIVEDIFIRNSTVQRAKIGINVNFYYGEGDSGDFTPIVRNIFIDNVDFNNVTRGFDLDAYSRSPVDMLVVKDSDFTGCTQSDDFEPSTNLRLIRVTRNGRDISNYDE